MQREEPGEDGSDGGADGGDDTSPILSTARVPRVTVSSLSVVMTPWHEALRPSLYSKENAAWKDGGPCLTDERWLEPSLPATNMAPRCSAPSWVCQAAGWCGTLGKVDPFNTG